MNDKIYNILRPVAVDEMFHTIPWIQRIKKMSAAEIASSAYLIIGPKGSGKTTLGRVMAHTIGVDSPMEINAAEERGVDKIRELKETIQLAPVFETNSAIILDEAGSLTLSAQKALLKELEDTPPHTCIILSTTDDEAIIDTIRDRCVVIRTRRLRIEEASKFHEYITGMISKRIESMKATDPWIKEALTNILTKITPQIVAKAIEAADGSIRGTLNGLHMYTVTGEIVQTSGSITTDEIADHLKSGNFEEVRKMINQMDTAEAINLYRDIGNRFLSRVISSNNKDNARLVNEYMSPIMHGVERTAIIARMVHVMTNWQG